MTRRLHLSHGNAVQASLTQNSWEAENSIAPPTTGNCNKPQFMCYLINEGLKITNSKKKEEGIVRPGS